MKSPFGARGERPVFFPCSVSTERARELTQIPGVARAPGGMRTTWDAAPFLATLLGQPCPRVPTEANLTSEELRAEVLAFPGYARYKALGLSAKLRDYQKEGAIFLARRSWAMNSDPMRSGKSRQSLAASVLIDAQKVLIVCPALAKYVWAEEVSKFVGEEAVILEGRGGDEVRQFCRMCDARGRVDGDVCPACRMRNGQSRGYKLTRVRSLPCKRHPDETGEGLCPACLKTMHEVISAVHYVIVNFDLLVSQKVADAAGGMHDRGDLPGWGPALAHHHFDLAIADEMHLLRGWSTDRARKGQTRRERFNHVTDQIPTVWGLTGTPVFGFTRDLWGQFDALSKGAMTGNGTGESNRLPFSFHARYCDGMRDSYGWKADGRSIHAETELVERLAVVKMQRPRSRILTQMPAKIRQVIRIDPTARVGRRKPSGTTQESKITELMAKTLAQKIDTVVENVCASLSAGEKVVVFTLLRKSAEDIGLEFEKAIKKPDIATRMRQVDAKVWTVHGQTQSHLRFEQARAFREHRGAAVFIATIDSVQVAVSLNGALSVHFADLHWQPSAMLQAEDRPYEVGITGLSIVYYVVRNSVDEHIEATVLPKVITLSRLVEEKGADELKKAFANTEEDNKTVAQILADLMKNADTSMGAFEDDE